jgi:hypothetical protein
MARQGGWRWCWKCQGLFFAGNPSQGACPAGSSHDSSQSGQYDMLFGDAILGAQNAWRWCQKCQGLFFSGNPSQGVCPFLSLLPGPTGNSHDGSASAHYSLMFGDQSTGTQGGWRWCQKCQGLFFSGSPAQGPCPAGGTTIAVRAPNMGFHGKTLASPSWISTRVKLCSAAAFR